MLKQRQKETLLSLFVFVGGTGGNQADLLAAELDLELIAGLEIKQCRVGLADQQVAIALDGSDVAEFAAALPGFGCTAKIDSLGIQESLVEGCEVQPFRTVFFVGDIAASANQVRLAHIPEFFDLGEKVGTSEYR